MMRALALAFGLCTLCALARAEPPDLPQAKNFFKAGAAAYEVGDYAAAVQALDSAYRITPLPAIAFSLAQAERRQYFVSHDLVHLERAIALFRGYLQDVPRAGRRADATEALSQLEPLAQSAAHELGAPAAISGEDKTRLMISCGARGALIALDDATAQPSPAIAQVAPGPHRVRVDAPGFFPSQRGVTAVAGAFVPVEIALRERPAVALVSSKPQSSLLVDGAFVGEIAKPRRLELPSGAHTFVFAKNGHRLSSFETDLAPGSTRDVNADLSTTPQRGVAVALFVAGGVGLAAGGVLAALAVAQQDKAVTIMQRMGEHNISADDLHSYDGALEDRGRLRAFAGVSLGLSVTALLTGLALFLFDQPDVRAPLDRRSRLQSPELQLGARQIVLRQRF